MAVYTDVSDEDLAGFLAAYDVPPPISFKGIAEGVENSNFLLQTEGESYILTIYEKRVARDDLPFFLGLMEHLAEAGIACPLPVKARDGSALRELRGRPAALITFLPGLWPRRIEVNHCRELGAAMADMHRAGADFAMTRANDLSIGGWPGLADACRARADEVNPGLADIVDTELAALAQSWPHDLPNGTIHADLFPDNVFFRDGRLSGIIDFYFACTDALAYDLAICLNAWCFETDGSFNVTKARRLLESYSSHRTLTPEELAALPILARGSALRFLLTRLYDWLHHPEGAFVKPKDPLEYLAKLRFHQTVTGPGAYGIG